MRPSEIEFIKALSISQISNIIPVIEKGLEIQKLEFMATRDVEASNQISDTCILLSFLHFRKLGSAA